MISRRRFLKHSGTIATGLSVGKSAWARGFAAEETGALVDATKLAKFVDPLPIIPVMRPGTSRPDPTDSSKRAAYYHVSMEEVDAQFHRDLKPTKMWGFNGSSPGPVFDTRGGKGVLVEWSNKLPKKHMFPVDYTLHGAERDKPECRSVIHLHGGRTPAASDGYPEDWVAPGKSTTYFYPNRQDATMLCYHDHTMAMARLNVYAGLQGLWLIRDESDAEFNLPKGKYEVPIVLCDRLVGNGGQLMYPVSRDAEKPWVPDVEGNVVLVNGKITPFFDAEPRRYRMRFANGSNGKTFTLEMPEGVEMFVIGTDQALLPAPVRTKQLLMAPGERMDVIFDFVEFPGRKLVLKSGTVELMQFRVRQSDGRDDSALPPSLQPMHRLRASDATKTRVLTIDKLMLNKTPWQMPITEKPVQGTTEIWELVNLTERVQPIHLGLVRFQVLDRHALDMAAYKENGAMRYMGPPNMVAHDEAGWKDTVRCEPGQSTRIIIPFDSYAGRYVWHTHRLEEADNEMMRPFEIVTPS